MRVREPVVAGQFYASDPKRCRADLIQLLDESASAPEADEQLIGGLVPHAGWMCSGAVAAKVFQALAASRTPKVVILFGGVHRARGQQAALFGSGRWETPLGPVEIDDRLAERILGHTNLIADDPYAHEAEHSIEVQMPFVIHLFPGAKVVPIMVPPASAAHEVGDAVGRTLMAYDYDAMVVGTTDLTHYGPSYGFAPQGVGVKGNTWAKEENDRHFIDLVLTMKSAEVVPEAFRNRNACSSGAAAATLAAVTTLGARKATLLEHTTSAEVLGSRMPGEMSDSVGYVAIIFS
jgi:AmmeMemoRadiSam system protein B